MGKRLRLKTAEIEKTRHPDYFKIAVSVDCVIFGYDQKELKVLLIKSDPGEFSGMYSLPGDLIKPDVDLETASYHMLKERTGMDDVYLKQVQAFGSIERHPSGRVITIAYYSLIDIRHHKLQLSYNELNWYPINEIKKLVSDHKLILDSCMNRLQEEIMDHPVIFNLLPEKFSLRELQEVYQSILGFELDRRNFRKRIFIKDWLMDINEMENDVRHRPGKLYKLNPEFIRKTSPKKTRL